MTVVPEPVSLFRRAIHRDRPGDLDACVLGRSLGRSRIAGARDLNGRERVEQCDSCDGRRGGLRSERLAGLGVDLAGLRDLTKSAAAGAGVVPVHKAVDYASQVARGHTAIEAYGDTRGRTERCVLPAEFLGSVGFKTQRAHPTTPRTLSARKGMSKRSEASTSSLASSAWRITVCRR